MKRWMTLVWLVLAGAACGADLTLTDGTTLRNASVRDAFGGIVTISHDGGMGTFKRADFTADSRRRIQEEAGSGRLGRGMSFEQDLRLATAWQLMNAMFDENRFIPAFQRELQNAAVDDSGLGRMTAVDLAQFLPYLKRNLAPVFASEFSDRELQDLIELYRLEAVDRVRESGPLINAKVDAIVRQHLASNPEELKALGDEVDSAAGEGRDPSEVVNAFAERTTRSLSRQIDAASEDIVSSSELRRWKRLSQSRAARKLVDRRSALKSQIVVIFEEYLRRTPAAQALRARLSETGGSDKEE